MSNNTRELIAQNIVDVLGDMVQPRLALVTREPFVAEELAITQFPAVLVQTGEETRNLESMSVGGLKSGTIQFVLRGFVRGADLDTRRNDLIERLEEALDSDRTRDLGVSRVMNSGITTITVIQRQPPLAEIEVVFEVEYVFTRGSA